MTWSLWFSPNLKINKGSNCTIYSSGIFNGRMTGSKEVQQSKQENETILVYLEYSPTKNMKTSPELHVLSLYSLHIIYKAVTLQPGHTLKSTGKFLKSRLWRLSPGTLCMYVWLWISRILLCVCACAWGFFGVCCEYVSP